MFRLELGKAFNKGYQRLSGNEQRAVLGKLEIMKENPFHPSLRTKKVRRLENIFECSVNMKIRIFWRYEDDRLILILDVGHHDIL